MASQSFPKMSLVAQYDDLCRYTSVLTSGPEVEFKTFVESQLNCMHKWKESEFQIRNLNEQVSDLQSENERLETKIKHLKGLLEDSLSVRKQIEMEKKCLANQIAIIKDVLLTDSAMDNQTREKLVLLSSTYKPDFNSPNRLKTIEESAGSLFSISDIDQTDENLDNRQSLSRSRRRRSRGKRSSSESKASTKKKKLDDINKSPNRDNDVFHLPSLNVRYQSDSDLSSNTPIIPAVYHQVQKSGSVQSKQDTYNFRKLNTRSLSVSTPVNQYNAVKRVNRCHDFVTKQNFLRIMKCNPCGQNIGMMVQSLKCQSCRMNCHIECKEKCPLPCFPIVNTPTKGTLGTIADYTSSASPMIPPIIVHCVNEIERRGLNKECGLYRQSGSDRDVKSLKEKFTGRTVPSLTNIDIHVICGAVKEFLRSLKEPLVTHNAWQAFVDAADLKERALDALYNIVSDLPQPNRDTLSFLILHLKKIAESPECKMNIGNLAKVFGPTIVGYSVPNPADTNLLNETPHQHRVMEQLLSIPSELWKNLLGIELNIFQDAMKKTPENLPAPKGTRLGPLYATSQKARNMNAGKNQQTPRNSRYNKPARMHFSSPLLK